IEYLSVCIFLITINVIGAFSYLNTYTSTIDVEDRGDGRPVFGDKYETVHIRCLADRAELVCYQPGTSYECSWAGATWCDCCNAIKVPFSNEDGDGLFNHAKDHIIEGLLIGSYTNNIYREPLGLTIFRTVSWNVDMVNLVATIEIIISDGQQ
ncbi:hypothetical protein GW891_04650, partial [bacterium]|nr:hypothetical protein [bacterium]